MHTIYLFIPTPHSPTNFSQIDFCPPPPTSWEFFSSPSPICAVHVFSDMRQFPGVWLI